MINIYLTRHGETEWNVEKRMQGHLDSPLTAKGIFQAEKLSEHLENIEFVSIYSSPSGRALKTAEIITAGKKTEIITDSNLREINMGEWEGCYYSDLERKYPEMSHAFWNDPALYKPADEKGEDFFDLTKRLKNALDSIVRTHESGNILIVTHGMSLKILLSIFKGLHLSDLKGSKVLPSVSLNIVSCKNGEYTVHLEGDTSHIHN